ncbi:flotillin domain-containing protein [Chitinispirillales bacterium ANBcel5]|uniref:flotillin family protein n=1 Tax=Cellulosispirillum alkaliphilum TaxID=3039283 RepID=UPI002A58DE69|nr:flotillin domain-containing protein [Chitinispirillales bacterium ANBcel5]
MVGFNQIFLIAAGVVILFVFSGAMIAKLYTKSSKERSFVRTGFGGQKIIMNGGALVLPVLHEIIKVNMNTLRLEVRRANEQALITRDRMRVDVTAEFYVRVKPTAEAIANAAQTLGRRTTETGSLKELVEGKFVDALRAVAAEMAMEELHEQRVDFVQKVQAAVSEDLLKNGLELESVSLTSLDQTRRDLLNAQNAFDAEGLTKLTKAIEDKRKERNDIEQDTEVKVRQKNLDAELVKLDLAKKTEYAQLAQAREVEVRKSQDSMETQKQQSDNMRLAEEALIDANNKIELARINSEKVIEQQRIENDRTIQEKEIEKSKMIQRAEIVREKEIKLDDQDRQIAIAEKSKAQSTAQAQADKARADAVKAQEEVVTVRETEVADRKKQIELIEAEQAAQREAIGITVAAQAQKSAADDKAAAINVGAKAEAEKTLRIARGQAESEVVLADAHKQKYLAEADGKRALHEAENLLSQDIIDMKIRLATIENMASIIAASMKPVEAIKDFKIIQVDGFTGGGGAKIDPTSSTQNASFADQVVSSALRYRGQAPMVDALLKEIGMSGKDIGSLTGAIKKDLAASGQKTQSHLKENPKEFNTGKGEIGDSAQKKTPAASNDSAS